MSTSIPIRKISPKSGLDGRTNEKLKSDLDWLQTAMVDKMQLKLHEELVMFWISLHA